MILCPRRGQRHAVTVRRSASNSIAPVRGRGGSLATSCMSRQFGARRRFLRRKFNLSSERGDRPLPGLLNGMPSPTPCASGCFALLRVPVQIWRGLAFRFAAQGLLAVLRRLDCTALASSIVGSLSSSTPAMKASISFSSGRIAGQAECPPFWSNDDIARVSPWQNIPASSRADLKALSAAFGEGGDLLMRSCWRPVRFSYWCSSWVSFCRGIAPAFSGRAWRACRGRTHGRIPVPCGGWRARGRHGCSRRKSFMVSTSVRCQTTWRCGRSSCPHAARGRAGWS
jgi:hypothetical protein